MQAGNLSAPFALSVRALREDSDLLVALRLLVSSTDEIRDYAKAFKGQMISMRNERRWRVLLRQQADALLRERELFSTADEDSAILASLSPGVSGRYVSALVTRLGEKRLLAEVLDELRQKGAQNDYEIEVGAQGRVE